MLEFFNIPHTYEKIVPDRNNTEKIVEVPNILPTFERFAVNIGVSIETLDIWRKHYPEFADIYKRCQAIQKDMLNDLALRGFYNATYTAFAAKNLTDMCKEASADADFQMRDAYLRAMSEMNKND